MIPIKSASTSASSWRRQPTHGKVRKGMGVGTSGRERKSGTPNHAVGGQNNDTVLLDTLQLLPQQSTTLGVHSRGRLIQENDLGEHASTSFRETETGGRASIATYFRTQGNPHTAGSPTKAMLVDRRRFMPPEKVDTKESSSFSRPTWRKEGQ